MCSIVIGTDTEQVKELAHLNKSRGCHSHSLFVFDREKIWLKTKHKALGPLDIDSINIADDEFVIIHQQAPTTESKDETNIHPSEFYLDYLWHNGILKSETIKKLQKTLDEPDLKWDTKLLHLALLFDEREVPEILSDIDGSFSCVAYEGKYDSLSMFRNEIAPMYTDGRAFSSTKFKDSTPIEPNVIHRLKFLEDGRIITELGARFTTKVNPYYFGD